MRAILSGAAICAACYSALAESQDALEEIVVTAGFREHSVMTGPGSASVIESDVIEERAAQHLEQILGATPNVSYSSGASRARFVQMRGIGDLEQFVDPKHYPAVGISLDDINLGGAANAAMLFDAEQVEILRGPQGTRFGTSALAGLVNIRSRQPTADFEGYVSAGVADYSGYSLGAAFGGPLRRRSTARLAVGKHESDGYIRNEYLGRDDTNGYDETSVRAAIDFEPSERVSFGLTGLYFDGSNGYDAFSLDNRRTTLSDQPGHDNQRSSALAGRVEWRVADSSRLEAVATWLDNDLDYGFDEDWTYPGICDGTLCDPVLDFFSNTDEYRRQRAETSLDLRWLLDKETSAGTPLRFVLGIYSQRRDEDLDRQYYGAFASAYHTEREALYAQGEIDLTNNIGVTVGLRHERFDDRYADSFAFSSTSEDSSTSGEVSLTFQATDASLLYATVSRGNKPGGVNTEASSSFPLTQPQFQTFLAERLRVGKETLTNLEVGLKGTYLGDRLALRAAVFRMHRRNAQLESWLWDGLNFLWIGFLDNADGDNTGIEGELKFAANDAWDLFASLGLLQAKVDEIVTFDLDLGDFVVRRDIDQAKAPDWQFSVGAGWSPSERWSARFEVEGRDESRYGYYHEGVLDGAVLVNGSVSYRVGATELMLWGRNLTDRDYPVHGLYFGNDPRKGWINESYFQLGEPRVVGVSAKYSF